MKFFRGRFLGFLTAVMVIVSVLGCGRKGEEKTVELEKPTQRGIPVRTMIVQRRSIESIVNATGTVSPIYEVTVSPRASGVIDDIRVDEGSLVKKGEVLAVLDQTDYLLAKETADAALMTAEASLKMTLAGTRDERIRQAEAAVTQAEANLENVRIELERTRELYQKAAIAKSALDQVETSYKVAEAQLKATEEGLAMATKGATPEEIEVAKAQVEQARVALKTAQTQLGYTVIKAPITGLVTKKYVEIGEKVQAAPQSMMFEVVDSGTVKVESSLPEDMLPVIRPGQRVEITIDAIAGRVFGGTVKAISPEVDVASRSFKIKIEISNPDLMIRKGMFARVKIVLEKLEEAVAIPKDVMISLNHSRYVFVAEEDRAVRREIMTGVEEGDLIEVKSGLEAGEELVVVGQKSLKDGDYIDIKGKE